MNGKMISMAVTALVLATPGAALGNETAAASAASPVSFVGLWNKVVTLRNCETGEVAPVPNPVFPAINTYHSGGTLSEHGARFSPAGRTQGQGIWRHTGPRSFKSRIVWQVFDVNGFFSGTFDVVAVNTISRNGNSMFTRAETTLTDPNGAVLVRGCATEDGRRVRL